LLYPIKDNFGEIICSNGAMIGGDVPQHFSADDSLEASVSNNACRTWI